MRIIQFTPAPAMQRMLGAIIILLSIIALELWTDRTGNANPVMGQIPDTALQRQLIVDEARRTNALLTDILDQLKNGRVKVVVESADKAGTSPPAGKR